MSARGICCPPISIHAPRTGSDLRRARQHRQSRRFQSTLPARGATASETVSPTLGSISIHAPRTGSDRSSLVAQPAADISIHAPRTGSDRLCGLCRRFVAISIHAPRTGSDNWSAAPSHNGGNFNPRSPHGERRASCEIGGVRQKFQSTLPARGATVQHRAFRRRHPHFNPRSPHGERRHLLAHRGQTVQISIHAPRTGSDISISQHLNGRTSHFNPRSPHGERHGAKYADVVSCIFQSTLPARGATHTLARSAHSWHHFNPRSPHGERPDLRTKLLVNPDFNPRSPHGERRNWCKPIYGSTRFQSTLPARGAT